MKSFYISINDNEVYEERMTYVEALDVAYTYIVNGFENVQINKHDE
jgi:hypothetical protein